MISNKCTSNWSSVSQNILQPEVYWKYFPNGCEFLNEILHAYCMLIIVYAILQNLTKLCPIKRNRLVNIYISLSVSDGELQNQPVCILSSLS